MPKLGPSLLISTCLILAIRTAKWAASHDEKLRNHDLDKEIDYAIHLAGSVLSKLLARKDAIFPQKREPWYQANDEDIPVMACSLLRRNTEDNEKTTFRGKVQLRQQVAEGIYIAISKIGSGKALRYRNPPEGNSRLARPYQRGYRVGGSQG